MSEPSVNTCVLVSADKLQKDALNRQLTNWCYQIQTRLGEELVRFGNELLWELPNAAAVEYRRVIIETLEQFNYTVVYEPAPAGGNFGQFRVSCDTSKFPPFTPTVDTRPFVSADKLQTDALNRQLTGWCYQIQTRLGEELVQFGNEFIWPLPNAAAAKYIQTIITALEKLNYAIVHEPAPAGGRFGQLRVSPRAE